MFQRTGPTDLETNDLILMSMGHSAFQYLYAGLELGVLQLVYNKVSMTGEQIGAEIGLKSRSRRCLLRGLTALRLLKKSGDEYTIAPLLAEWFGKGRYEVLLKLVRFQARIVYPGEIDFVESLISDGNAGLRRIPGAGIDLYHRLQQDTTLQSVFYEYMGAWSGETIALVQNAVDLSSCKLVADLGGGEGTNSIGLARANPATKFLLLDIPSVCSLADRRIRDSGLAEQIEVRAFDLFKDPFPCGPDCFLFFHLLVIWGPRDNILLLKKAYDALPVGGRIVIFSSMGSDDDEGPLFSALDSAYFMAIPSRGGFIYAWKDYEEWLAQVGFRLVQRVPCDFWTPHGILVATK